jgi:hypothetical protein
LKNIGIAVGVGTLLIIGIAIFFAGQMGEKEKFYAKGTVVLADDLKDAAKEIETLFIVVSDVNRPRPPYGAAKRRIDKGSSGTILEFVLTNDNIQKMQEIPWPAQFKLKVRLDRDGMGGMDQPGDLVGELTNLKPGADNLEIRISQKI